MLLDEFVAVGGCQTQVELHEAVMRFMRHVEFDRMGAGAVVDSTMNESIVRAIDNTPSGYRDAFEDIELGRRDPVMQHCKTSGLPIVWDRSTYIAAGCADKWELQAAYGYKTGIAAVVHLPRGRHFYVGFDREQSLPRDRHAMSRMVADVQLFVALAYETGFRLLWPEGYVATEVQHLTPRESECLRWTMEGKTAWEVGRILSISEQTAARHICNATHKLDCISKHQAVLKALRLGLIR
jgi:DNA-binding CsgD family transcriptional regulator